MPLIDAYALGKTQAVMEDTWGHLRPKRNRAYSGRIVFAHGEYGDIVPIRCHFDGLPDSPWFFDDMIDFISDQCHGSEGAVYLFLGTYTARHRDCRGAFDGTVEVVNVG